MWEWSRRVTGLGSAAAASFSSSFRLLWIMMPLFLVAALAVFSGPRTSFLLFASPFLHGRGGVFNGSSTPQSQEIFRPNISSETNEMHENITSIAGPLLPTEHEETKNGTSSLSSNSSEDGRTTSSSSSRKYSKLEMLEAGLARSRASILRGNSTKDDDFIPNGPMYWNASVFHRKQILSLAQFSDLPTYLHMLRHTWISI